MGEPVGCRKKCYPSPQAAWMALKHMQDRAARRSRFHRKPTGSVYQCDVCPGAPRHTTSAGDREREANDNRQHHYRRK